jgi:hypothetical protein
MSVIKHVDRHRGISSLVGGGAPSFTTVFSKSYAAAPYNTHLVVGVILTAVFKNEGSNTSYSGMVRWDGTFVNDGSGVIGSQYSDVKDPNGIGIVGVNVNAQATAYANFLASGVGLNVLNVQLSQIDGDTYKWMWQVELFEYQNQ